MTRSCFLSVGGDVFISSLVIKLWQERWRDEISTFWICFNNHAGVPKEVVSEFLARHSQDPKIRIIYMPQGCGNGFPIKLMTLCSTDDLVMLCEDDFFTFESGIVNECFQKIESDLTDAVGSPRFSCGNEIADALKKKYNLDYSGYGDRGPLFWPTGFFCKRKDLLKTDLNFSSKSFMPGEYCKELNYTFKEVNHADTFGWAGIQLRYLGLRFHNVPQHHADPYEIQSKEKNEMNWHPTQQPFNWLHGGSLSAGWGGYLTGTKMNAHDDSSLREMESRCALWTIACINTDGFNKFKKEYQEGIRQLVEREGLDWGNINKKIAIYKSLMRV